METHSLCDLKISETAIVVSLEGEGDLIDRLKELGLVKGTRVTLKRFAPLGDPMEIFLRGYNLSLRKQDAKMVRVQKV